MQTTSDITIRLADYPDARRLIGLAALDSAQVPDGPLLVAEAGGDLVAAVPLGGGRPIADPFRRTADLVRMLELRAQQLHPGGDDRASRLAAAARAVAPRPHLS